MTVVDCIKRKCLNNKKGKCTAEVIEYDGLCQSYITYGHTRKLKGGLCVRSHGKLKHKNNKILK